MSVRRLDPNQPSGFEFSPDNLVWAEKLVAKYPEGKQASAVIPLLWRVQEQNDGWVTEPAIRKVAEMLDMAFIRVYEVATFYTMFQLSPVGKKAHIQVCGTTPCMLRGAEDLIGVCKRRIAAHAHEISQDGDFSWEEVECLGACVNAPMVQVWKDTYEDLTPESFEALIDTFASGKAPTPGPQTERQLSEPAGGATALTSDPETLFREWHSKRAPSSEDTPAQQPFEDTAAKHEAGAKMAVAVSQDDDKGAAATGDDDNETVPNRPDALDSPRDGGADDLKRISGIGPTLEEKLNNLGFFHFDQIAIWTKENIAWVDDELSFRGRIERDDWIEQAKTLASGQETEFSKRVDAGEVSSNKADT